MDQMEFPFNGVLDTTALQGEEASTILELYVNQHLPLKQIAGILGCSEEAVNARRKAEGIPRRKRKRYRDLVGQKFGKWTPLYYIGYEGTTIPKWACRCDCGNIRKVQTDSLTHGRSTKCRECCHKELEISIEVNPYYWRRVLVGARKRNLEVGITIEEARDLFYRQNKQCALTGLPIRSGRTVKEFKDKTNTASLDRIDSSRGYVPGNVQWVHKDINNMKQAFPQERFIELCQLVAKHSSIAPSEESQNPEKSNCSGNI